MDSAEDIVRRGVSIGVAIWVSFGIHAARTSQDYVAAVGEHGAGATYADVTFSTLARDVLRSC